MWFGERICKWIDMVGERFDECDSFVSREEIVQVSFANDSCEEWLNHSSNQSCQGRQLGAEKAESVEKVPQYLKKWC